MTTKDKGDQKELQKYLSEWQKRHQEYLEKKSQEKASETDEEERNDETFETSESAGTNETDNSEDEKEDQAQDQASDDDETNESEETEDVEEPEEENIEELSDVSEDRTENFVDQADIEIEKEAKSDKPRIEKIHLYRAIPVLVISSLLILLSLYFITPLGSLKNIVVTGNERVTQDEIIKLSKKVILESPDKMSEYLLKNKLEGLPDKLSTLNTFYMYMSGSGNEAANNLIDCKRNGLEWSEKFSDMLGLFFKTILSSESDYHCESLNMLSSLASQFAFESDVLPKKDYNKFAFVDNEGENMLLLKTSDQNFEFDVQALCNKKQLPIDSFSLAKIDSVTIKGLDKMKMEYAVNAFDTLYNLLLNNDNILVDQLNFDILKVFQKTFGYNLIGLKNRQNSELSEFIKQIIKNNEK